nr:AlNc14C1128G12795 [Albugo laibachii Nc14]|eukprot:CCA28096.1 AlNc14C1128G12795 [Albugo laibachii Nc14]
MRKQIACLYVVRLVLDDHHKDAFMEDEWIPCVKLDEMIKYVRPLCSEEIDQTESTENLQILPFLPTKSNHIACFSIAPTFQTQTPRLRPLLSSCVRYKSCQKSCQVRW